MGKHPGEQTDCPRPRHLHSLFGESRLLILRDLEKNQKKTEFLLTMNWPKFGLSTPSTHTVDAHLRDTAVKTRTNP